MPRGRLIFPFIARFGQLDTSAIEAASGYDDIYQEPVKQASGSGDTDGTTARIETTLDVRVQVESESQDVLNMVLNGDSPNGLFVLVAHFKDLEAAGLVDAQGKAMIRKGDRLVSLHTVEGTLVEEIGNLYVTEVQSRGFGLSFRTPKRNLLFIHLRTRDQGATS